MLRATLNKRRLVVVVATLLLAFSAAVAAAQTGGMFDLSWNTVDGGGGTSSTGGNFSLGGTIGQPDAGVSSGGVYTVSGGFWPGAAPAAPSPTPTVEPVLVGL